MAASTFALFLSTFQFIANYLSKEPADQKPAEAIGTDSGPDLSEISSALTEIRDALTGVAEGLNGIRIEISRISATLLEIAIHGDQLRAKGNLESAYTLLNSGVFDEALLQFRKARELDPSNIALWSGIVSLRCRLDYVPRSPTTDTLRDIIDTEFPGYLEKAVRLTYSCAGLEFPARMAFIYVLYSAAMQLGRPRDEELAASSLIQLALADNLTDDILAVRTRPLLSLRPRGSIPSMLQRVNQLHWQFIQRDVTEIVRLWPKKAYEKMVKDIAQVKKNYALLPTYARVRDALAHLEALLTAIVDDEARLWNINDDLKCDDPERIREAINRGGMLDPWHWARRWAVILFVLLLLLAAFLSILLAATIVASIAAVIVGYCVAMRFGRRRNVLAEVRAKKEGFPELEREAASIQPRLAANKAAADAQLAVLQKAFGIT